MIQRYYISPPLYEGGGGCIYDTELIYYNHSLYNLIINIYLLLKYTILLIKNYNIYNNNIYIIYNILSNILLIYIIYIYYIKIFNIYYIYIFI